MNTTRRKLLLGGIVAACGASSAAGQPPQQPGNAPGAAKAPPATVPDPIRAADPLGAMLAEAKTAVGRMRDYTCVFTRQERVNNVLTGEQVAEMRVRAQPYSVYVRFAKPEANAGLEMAYVTGWRLGKMRYRPGGLKPGTTTMTVSLDDPKVMAESRRPVTELSIQSMIDRVSASVAREKAMGNPVEVFSGDFEFAGRQVTRYEIFTRRPHALRYAYKVCVYVDKETRIPVRFEAYDQPKSGQAAGELLEVYSFTNLRPNAGLGDSSFEL